MRILKFQPYILVITCLTFFGAKSHAQQSDVSVIQDSRFEQLLNEKRKINSSITVNDKYKIQIFYGDNEKARKTLNEFRREFKNLDGTIVFESPTYKVWVGNFKSKIEAERNLVEIRKKYPYALMINPNK
jgi:hypothetical protein